MEWKNSASWPPFHQHHQPLQHKNFRRRLSKFLGAKWLPIWWLVYLRKNDHLPLFVVKWSEYLFRHCHNKCKSWSTSTVIASWQDCWYISFVISRHARWGNFRQWCWFIDVTARKSVKRGLSENSSESPESVQSRKKFSRDYYDCVSWQPILPSGDDLIYLKS